MISDSEILRQLPYVLCDTDFDLLGEKYCGKVRDCYSRGNIRYLIATDRLSCFDVVVTTVPFKGQVLTSLAFHWFKLSSHIITNHVIDVPDPNVMVVKNCEIIPIEVVLRNYLAGSAWRDYEAGRAISGVRLPPGLKAYQKLAEPILTPSHKAPKGQHDQPMSEEQILARGLVSHALWEQIKEAAFALFVLGIAEAMQQGLILVDTKYEFGLHAGKLILADEIHTLDSSRYWIKSSYEQRLAQGQVPEMLDKEPTRQWLLQHGYKGEGAIPEFTAEHRVAIARHYIDALHKITGRECEFEVGTVLERIRKCIK